MNNNQFGGPPHRKTNKSPERLTADILACKRPTYYNVGRAWNILGYYRSPRPTLASFVLDVEALWWRQNNDRSLKGRRARAAMLDALRTLGFRNYRWRANIDRIHLFVGDQDGSWANLPDPPRGGNNYGKSDAREYLAVTAPAPSIREAWELQHYHLTQTWGQYHRYQGFRTRNFSMGQWLLMRAFPVPPGPDSLWHSVSYWIYQRRIDPQTGEPEGGPSIWHYWQVKARIWTYFMQVLKDPTHERWTEYQALEHLSKTADPDFGTLSIARSLYASQSQGRPAYPHKHLLHVIADYFDTQIVVFQKGATSLDLDQFDNTYTYSIFGARNPGPQPIIFIATNRSYTHFDPVDFDEASLHEVPGFGGHFPSLTPAQRPAHPNGPASRTYWTNGPGLGLINDQHSGAVPWPVNHNGPRPPHAPWQMARYNFIWDNELFHLRANGLVDAAGMLDNNPNMVIPRLTHAPGPGLGRVWGYLPDAPVVTAQCTDVVLTRDIWGCFEAGIDVPGFGFETVDDATMQVWLTGPQAKTVRPTAQAPVPVPWANAPATFVWQWRFGKDPMGFPMGALPDRTVETGRQMLEDPYMEFERDKWRSIPWEWM